MPTPLTLDPANWNSSVVAPYTLGALYETGGKVYRYVQLASEGSRTDTPGNGTVVEQQSTTSYVVSTDRSANTTVGRAPVGVLVGTVTDGYYCFMQVDGIHPAVRDAANGVAVTNFVRSHTTADGDADVGSGSTINIGWALASASGGTFPAMLTMGGA